MRLTRSVLTGLAAALLAAIAGLVGVLGVPILLMAPEMTRTQGDIASGFVWRWRRTTGRVAAWGPT